MKFWRKISYHFSHRYHFQFFDQKPHEKSSKMQVLCKEFALLPWTKFILMTHLISGSSRDNGNRCRWKATRTSCSIKRGRPNDDAVDRLCSLLECRQFHPTFERFFPMILCRPFCRSVKVKLTAKSHTHRHAQRVSARGAIVINSIIFSRISSHRRAKQKKNRQKCWRKAYRRVNWILCE